MLRIAEVWYRCVLVFSYKFDMKNKFLTYQPTIQVPKHTSTYFLKPLTIRKLTALMISFID